MVSGTYKLVTFGWGLAITDDQIHDVETYKL